MVWEMGAIYTKNILKINHLSLDDGFFCFVVPVVVGLINLIYIIIVIISIIIYY